jgi:tRNA A-37 threonylcarbamoyl transferase component Bud32
LPVSDKRGRLLSDPREAVQAALGGRYRLDREIGQGGMAIVYLAQDLGIDRQVAVKVLRPELASMVGPERFAREVRIAAHLQHPNILQVIEAGDAAGIPYYITPYVEGDSLADRLHRETVLPIEAAVRIASEVADALALAHGHGIVHRDIKPANILLAGGHALVADFGIARALDEAGAERLTLSGMAMGTPCYMSPEQASGTAPIDPRSDLYSLGCVLYEMLGGDPPFTGPSAQAVLARHSLEPVRHLRVVRSTVSPALEAVVERALAKVPADRFADAADFKRALQDALLRPGRVRRPVPRRLAWVGLSILLAAAAIVAVVAIGGGRGRLGRHTVVVFPLVESGAPGGGTAGEDLATVIGHALDGVESLRWIDGWSLLDEAQRDDPRTLAPGAALAIARGQGAAYFVTGRVVARAESVGVYLELHDVAGDTVAVGSSAVGSRGEAWRVGLRSLNGLLPTLIPSGAPSIAAQWEGRSPVAVASFLLGEGFARRARFDSALVHYNAAVAADSQFVLAAVRGAEAANWVHEDHAARALIALALTHRTGLDPRLATFVDGYAAYLDGSADEAVAALGRAVAIDRGSAQAWWQLGETYTHLLPRGGPPDSLAEAALAEAHRLDPAAVYVVYHLVEIAIRRGERQRADRLARALDAARADSTLSVHVRIMRRCVFDGVDAVDWRRAVREAPQLVLTAGKSLAAAGSQLPCAERAFRAVLAGDTASDAWGVGRRWSALVGLQSLLVARGRGAEVPALLDSAAGAGMPAAAALFLLDAVAGADVGPRAAAVATRDAERFGADYRRTPSNSRLWLLALWEASQRRPGQVAAVAAELEARARGSSARQDRLLADAVAAHAVLARGDSVEALRRFEALVPTSPAAGLVWDLAEPLAVERLVLMRLLLAQGRTREALDVGAVFDSPQPLIHLLFLRVGLELRVRAAQALRYDDLARRLAGRLERLGSSPGAR